MTIIVKNDTILKILTIFKEMYMKGKFLITFLMLALFFAGCKTVKNMDVGTEAKTEAESNAEKTASSLAEEQQMIKEEDEKQMVEVLQKQVDIEKTIVYVEKPVYRPAEEKNDIYERQKTKAGFETVKHALDTALKQPEKYNGAVISYDFDERFVYEIYCAPYRITDIKLAPGEEVLETPFLSEPEVWQVGAGVSKDKGVDVQHFFLKPSYSKLTTSMIIITNRRVYHLLLKSYKESFMAMVKWNYPTGMPYTVKSEMLDGDGKIKTVLEGISPEFLSFDYKMKYSPFKKPLWLPKRVYDDGRKTYIELDERVFGTKMPSLFDGNRNIINYRVKKNILIIDSLITKVTLRLDKQKVSIEKKKSKE